MSGEYVGLRTTMFCLCLFFYKNMVQLAMGKGTPKSVEKARAIEKNQTGKKNQQKVARRETRTSGIDLSRRTDHKQLNPTNQFFRDGFSWNPKIQHNDID